jgi:uncharacterized protein (DUF849 family)
MQLSAGKFSFTHYVSLSKVNEVIDAVMHKLPSVEIDQCKALLKKKSIEKMKMNQVESSYFLRIMLEYYKREKKCKYVALVQMMEKMENTGFDNFKILCKNLNNEATET